MFLEIAATTETIESLRLAVDGPMRAHVAAIAAALQDGWEIDRIDSDDGASLLLTPVARPQTDTAFLVEATGHRFALSVLQDDTLEFRGSYGSVKAMISACVAG